MPPPPPPRVLKPAAEGRGEPSAAKGIEAGGSRQGARYSRLRFVVFAPGGPQLWGLVTSRFGMGFSPNSGLCCTLAVARGPTPPRLGVADRLKRGAAPGRHLSVPPAAREAFYERDCQGRTGPALMARSCCPWQSAPWFSLARAFGSLGMSEQSFSTLVSSIQAPDPWGTCASAWSHDANHGSI